MSVSAVASNYTPVGDILVMAICLLFAILIHSSFINRTRSFLIFCVMLILLAFAAGVNAAMHVLVRAPGLAPWAVITLRVLYYSALFANLYLFIFYFLETMHIGARSSWRCLAVCTAGLAVLIGYMVVGAALNLGSFRHAADLQQALMQVFACGYIFFVSIMAYLSLRYRGRISRQVTRGVLASSSIAFLLLIVQSLYGQLSYTTVSFLFPAAALLYLVHANPYDLEIGAVTTASFEEYVSYHRRHNSPLLLMSLLLPDFEESGRKYPVELQQAIRHFTLHFFRGAVLFQVSGGRMILAMETRRNPNYQATVHTILDRFGEEYEQFRFDHKIVVATTSAQETGGGNFDYIGLIQYVESLMPTNSARHVSQSDLDDYRTYRYILGELLDIDLQQDMDDPRVVVYCQPVLNLRTGRYDTAEALMRLNLEKTGLVMPERFIPLAEESGCITALSMIILSKTCAQIRRLTEEGFFVRRISVNFSMLDLRDPDFSSRVSQIIHDSGIPSEMVAIELTESQNERDFMLVKERISELRESGIKFYLDDFGTGYSNFDRIMELPFDIIKFDRSLVVASGADAEKKTMVSYLARMFTATHYSVLYEGVETDSDQERCAEMCAEYLQGYKFSAPIPIERLREYFEKAAPAVTAG